MISSNTYKQFLILFVFTLVSCGGGGSDPEPTPDPAPEAAVLIKPLDNTECNQGRVISDTSSRVDFEWNKGINATKYVLQVTNLNDNSIEEVPTSNTKTTVTLLRGTPYSWKVISKNNSTTQTATSSSWKFYNAGKAEENYAPFPADLLSPAMGALTNQTVSLKWKGSDVDFDIASYDVYLDTNPTPTTLKGTTESSSIEDISLSADTLYYWMVVTKDEQGNTSQSPVYEFRTE